MKSLYTHSPNSRNIRTISHSTPGVSTLHHVSPSVPPSLSDPSLVESLLHIYPVIHPIILLNTLPNLGTPSPSVGGDLVNENVGAEADA